MLISYSIALLQAFPGELVDQVSEPLVFVNFLRESDVDEITGEVVSSCPMCYESVPGGTIEARYVYCYAFYLSVMSFLSQKLVLRVLQGKS